MYRKVYVSVTVKYNEAGQAKPLSIEWEDGRVYEIDRVLDVRQAVSLKVGGRGTRYTCRIGRQQTFLFEDEHRWYVEAK